MLGQALFTALLPIPCCGPENRLLPVIQSLCASGENTNNLPVLSQSISRQSQLAMKNDFEAVILMWKCCIM